ncbi:hypothetical protein MC45_08935 [Sphingomonas taxi]|uniref:Uncharacterized protein n=1 Tax=Sphingomonas taxi TaxID=1549858 RepID=A0A097EFX7_9SPHN|nr:hypothetical protein MC45_08935 [Sphingomonas taxi]
MIVGGSREPRIVYLGKETSVHGFTPTSFERFDCERCISEAQSALTALRSKEVKHGAKAIFLTDPCALTDAEVRQERRDQ